jgi:hypothetical protein
MYKEIHIHISQPPHNRFTVKAHSFLADSTTSIQNQHMVEAGNWLRWPIFTGFPQF